MVIVTWTEDKKEKAINILTKYFEKYGIGETIVQDDDALIEAPEILANIADKILIEGDGIKYE